MDNLNPNQCEYVKKTTYNSTRSPALVKAQEKYNEKMKLLHPDLLKERRRKYAKNQYDKNKDKEDFKEKNRDNLKSYYYENRDKILEKRRISYQLKKEQKNKLQEKELHAEKEKENI